MAIVLDKETIAFQSDAHKSANVMIVRRELPFANISVPDVSLTPDLLTAEVIDRSVKPNLTIATAGHRAKSSFDDWYFRIHITPAQFILGTLVGNQQRSVTLWNAYLNTVSLDAFSMENAEGIGVTQPLVPPATVKPLKVLIYQFDITPEGPPVIDATAIWTIDGVQYEVPFIGRRIVVFPFKPDWSNAVEETLEWKTTLETFYTGKEQISEIRSKPRRIVQYNFRLFENDLNIFDNVVFGWTGRLFAAPLWPEKTRTTGDVIAGALVLPLLTDTRTFEPKSLALIFRDVTDHEIVEVESVTATSVTLARPTAKAWPAGTRVYPMMVAAPEADIPTTRRSDTHADGLVRFTVNPADNFIRLPEVPAPKTYRSHELYTGKTNWVAPLDVQSTARRTLHDSDTGLFNLIRKAPFPLIRRGFRWLAGDREAAERLREFFGRRRGRLKPVWIESGTRDFVLAEPATAVALTFHVIHTDYQTFVDLHGARRDVLVTMRDGQQFARRIVSYGLHEDGHGALTLDAALGVDATPQNVKRISFLGLYRLESDSVTFVWRTNEKAVIESNLVLKEAP